MRQIAPISVPSVESIKQRRDLLGTKGELERIQHKLERAERALESLSRILTLIPDPIEIVTSDYTILFANRASRLLHDDERLEGSFYFQSVMGLEEPPPDCPVRRAIEDDREAAYTAACDNGDVFEVTVTPVVLSDGRRAAMCLSKQIPAATNDTTERHADDESDSTENVAYSDDEAELLQKIAELSTQTLDVVLDQVTDGVVMLDMSGLLILSNAAFQDLADIDQSTQADADLVVRMLCPDREEGTSAVAAIAELAADPGTSRFETELIRRDGERVPVELAVSRVCGESENETVLLVTLRDLREANKLKDRMLEALAVPTTINMNHLVGDVFSRHYLAEDLRLDNIEVVQRYDPAMVETTGFRVLLQHALANIIRNARETMVQAKGGGQLMVLTEASPDTITIRISHNGPGVPEEVQSKVFNRSFGSKLPIEGPGAGLYFAREVITRHEGTFEVKSHPGEGATLIIRLPVRPPCKQDTDSGRDTTPPHRD